jgi:hypothetical protein
MKNFLWLMPIGVFVATLALAQEPAPKPAMPHRMPHEMMRDGDMMPPDHMGGMMGMMQSMTPEEKAKMVEHCRQMMAQVTSPDSEKSDK